MKQFIHDNLTVRPLFKKHLVLYITRRFVTAFTTARQWPPSWGQLIQSTRYQKYFCNINFNIILPPVLRSFKRTLSFMLLRLHMYIFPFPSIRATCSVRLILRDLITRIFGEDCRSWSSSSLLSHLSSSEPDVQHPSLCSYHNLRQPQHTTSQSEQPCHGSRHSSLGLSSRMPGLSCTPLLLGLQWNTGTATGLSPCTCFAMSVSFHKCSTLAFHYLSQTRYNTVRVAK